MHHSNPESGYFIILCYETRRAVTMRELATTVMEVVGFVCLGAVGFTISLTFGLVSAGLALILLGYLIGRG